MDPKDPYRAANLLIQQLSANAATSHAASRCVELKLAGDQDGVRVWIAVAAAIMQLQATEPAQGQALH